jgi:hypothetical protein
MKTNAFAAASAVMAVSLGLAGAAEAATLRVIALTGQEAPGTGGLLFSGPGSFPELDIYPGFSSPSLNDAGEVAFSANLSGAGVTAQTNTGVFTSGALVAREGDVAPGTGGSVFSAWPFSVLPMLNNAGEVAFRSNFAGAGGDGQAIFRSDTLVARTGDAVPGSGGAVLTGFLFSPQLNDAGEVAFSAPLTGAGVTDENDFAIFADGAIVVREGDAAPGVGGAVLDTLFSALALNDAGEVAFRARLSGAGVTDETDTGIFTSGALVARAGDAAPGAGGAVFSDFGFESKLNDAGEVAFRGFLTGAGVTDENDAGIFASGALVARTGDAAPGAGGAVFNSFGLIDVSGFELNDLGETAFAALLGGAGVTEANDRALFATRGGVLDMILREGDLLDLGGANSDRSGRWATSLRSASASTTMATSPFSPNWAPSRAAAGCSASALVRAAKGSSASSSTRPIISRRPHPCRCRLRWV